MVIRGRSRSNGPQLADYLLNSRGNDRAHVIDIRGTAQPDSLKKSLLEMSLSSELTKRGIKGLYHAQINPAIGEDQPMTGEDWIRAADVLEQSLGYDGQKRAIVLHEKKGRLHGHIVWERYDHETGNLRTDSWNYPKHDQARAQIEQEFGHERTPQRAEREPTDKERLTALWQQHTEGAEFVQAAEEAGYRIAQKDDRRPFRAITPEGKSVDLVRQLDAIKTKEVRDRLQPIRDQLPTEADTLQRLKAERERAAERGQPEPEQSDDTREMSDSQDLAMAMLNRNKTPKSGQTVCYGFTINQPLKTQSEMLYSDLLAKQQEELRTLSHDYYVAHETIKKLQGEHYNAGEYAGEAERLQAAHAQNIKDSQARFEQEKKEYLNEAPALPQQPDKKTESEKSQDLSDVQDRAAAMIKQYQQRQADRRGKVQEVKTEGTEQTEKIKDDTLTDEANRMIEEYHLKQKELKRQRGRGRKID